MVEKRAGAKPPDPSSEAGVAYSSRADTFALWFGIPLSFLSLLLVGAAWDVPVLATATGLGAFKPGAAFDRKGRR